MAKPPSSHYQPVFKCNKCSALFSKGKKLKKLKQDSRVSTTPSGKGIAHYDYDQYQEDGSTKADRHGTRVIHHCEPPHANKTGLAILVGTRMVFPAEEIKVGE
ncbi:MAG: hypothetical protein AAB628_01455 [Patescibacteria group bacterium]